MGLRAGLLNGRWPPNSSRHYLRRINEEFAQDMREGMMVLDAGAGSQQYYDIFGKFQYESADFEMVDKYYTPSTYVCDLKEIPVEDARYDRVVLNQVLEHLPSPGLVLSELYRVLKPGGRMICTCPFFYEEHEQPFDFYRYTQFGHRHLFTSAGFEIERLEWLEGYLGTIAYQLGGLGKDTPINIKRYIGNWRALIAYPFIIMSTIFALGLAGLFSWLDMIVKVTDRGYPKNYVVIALKPDESNLTPSLRA